MNNGMGDFQPSVSTTSSDSSMHSVQAQDVLTWVVMGAFVFTGFCSVCIQKCDSYSEAEVDGSGQRGSEIMTQHDGASHGGLDMSILNSFPIVSYFVLKGLRQLDKDAMVCAVCLTEFQDNASLRMLPKCGHSFHPDCIDMWLFSHSTCPLCRQSLVSMPEEHHSLDIILAQEEAFSDSVRSSEENPSRDERAEVRISIDEAAEENNEAVGSVRDANRTAGRVGERETSQVLSRNSQPFTKAVQDLESPEKSSLLSVKNLPVTVTPINYLRRSYSFGGSGRSLRNALGVKIEAYSSLQARAADSTQRCSRLQHSESCSTLTELISSYQEVGGDRNPCPESSGNA